MEREPSSEPRRALVLGAGGHAAIAWETGVLAGLADAAIDVRDADLVVGTSAGSIVAAQITSGIPVEELFRRQVDPRLQTSESAPRVDFKRWRADILRSKEGGVGAGEFLRRIGSLAAVAPAEVEAERRQSVVSRLPAHVWPAQPLLIVAVDADTGERRVFDRTCGVSLVDAAMASCAVAGIWPAVTIDGRRYFDGGFYSTDNADLAIGCDRILILALQAGVPPLCAVSIEQALQVVRGAGAQVEVVHPDEMTRAVFASVSGNLLDPAVREPAARAGREQGRRIADLHVRSLWRREKPGLGVP